MRTILFFGTRIPKRVRMVTEHYHNIEKNHREKTILVFDRSREKGGANQERRDVLFVDASRDYQPGKNQNSLSDEHIQKIVESVAARQTIEKYAHLATFEEIRDNGFNLNIPRYVDTFEEEVEIDIDAIQVEIEQLESELVAVRAKMAAMLKEIER